MKSVFICGLLLLAFITNSTGQQLIARQHGGTPSFYTDLNQAITEASGGDTLYLPGEAYPLNVHIDKELHLIGTGHHPDSSRVSGISYITNVVYLREGAQKSSFEGLYFPHTITIFDATVTHLSFKRCNIYHLNYSVVFPTNYMYCTFSENIFREGINANMSNCRFNNCIFQTHNWGAWTNCTFTNNIFLTIEWVWHPDNNSVSYSRFENNVFRCGSLNFGPVNNSRFYNNIYFYISSYLDGITRIGSNNIGGIPLGDLFKNQSGDAFDYSHDYNLLSAGKNAGTDGTDIGIYGGPSPWKDGSVPFNPHIQAKTISGYTNADGTLNVQIKVKAQDR